MITKKMFMLPVVIALLAFSTGANAQVVTGAPRLGVQLLSNGLTANPTPGMSNATYAVIRLDTTYSGDDVRISSLPLIVTPGNGAIASNLNNCAVFNAANASVPLNSGSNVSAGMASGLNSINFNSPLVLPRGTVTTLNVNCNLNSGALNGGTYQFSLNTANVSAVGNTSGVPAVVTVGTGAPVVVDPGTGVIGVPNTGMGGAASANIALLLASIAAASFGALYVRKASR